MNITESWIQTKRGSHNANLYLRIKILIYECTIWKLEHRILEGLDNKKSIETYHMYVFLKLHQLQKKI